MFTQNNDPICKFMPYCDLEKMKDFLSSHNEKMVGFFL
jgi:hypothetical protein